MNAWFQVTDHDVLRIEGADAVDLLHRLSTNDLLGLSAANAVRQTLFTTNQGRLIDWLWLVSTSDGLLALASPGRAQRLVTWVDGYTIMENAKSTDVSSHRAHVRLHAPTGSVADADLCRALDVPSLPPAGVASQSSRGTWFVRPPAFGAWMDGLVPREQLPALTAALAAAGLGAAPASLAELARIEAGVPGPATEYSDEVNPLELRLGPQAVSFTKGCYIGQEVIARLDSYDKVARLLVGYSSDSATDFPQTFELKLTHEDRPLGRVTSVAHRADGRLSGLAIVKRELAIPGTAAVLHAGEQEVPVRLEERGFWALK